MTISARALCIGCTAAFLSGGVAQAQEACTTYTVVAGDNLRNIARKAYGDGDLFRVIYNANVRTIGAKADLITIGAALVIPCDPNAPTDGQTASVAANSTPLATGVIDPAKQPLEVVPELPRGTAGGADVPAPPEPEATIEVAAATPAPPEVTEAPAELSIAPTAPPIRLVTGNGYAPFVDKTLPGGGMFTQLVEMAVFRADPAIVYNLTFINDWQAHIDALLPSLAYDLSFPWIRPDCDGGTMLSSGDQYRCDNFVFSAPFYEIVDGFYASRDSELLLATTYAGFEGARICRPEGYTTGVLDAVGLSAPRIELIRPSEAVYCFEALAAGKVDLVSVDTEVGDAALARLGTTGKYIQSPYLFTLQSLHVIAHKSNPTAVRMVGLLDEGLIEMYDTGEWYDIVSTALEKFIVRE